MDMLLVLIKSNYSSFSANDFLISHRPSARQVWLFYWVGYAVLGFLMSFWPVAWMVEFPFTVVAMILFDVYYEAQLLAVVALVNPRVRMLDRVVELTGDKIGPLSELAQEKIAQLSALVQTQMEKKE